MVDHQRVGQNCGTSLIGDMFQPQMLLDTEAPKPEWTVNIKMPTSICNWDVHQLECERCTSADEN